jgi:hypothetical protein
LSLLRREKDASPFAGPARAEFMQRLASPKVEATSAPAQAEEPSEQRRALGS